MWAIQVKHPLFLLTAPLYRLGSALYSGVQGHLAHNLRMSFPMAILGAGAVCVAYLVFLRNWSGVEQALLFTTLYGVSGNMWFFSSLPETYVLTALCTNLALWTVWRTSAEPAPRDIYLAAGANALACFAA